MDLLSCQQSLAANDFREQSGVSCQIEEAVILADRIIVLGRNPGRIRANFPVSLSHWIAGYCW